MTTSIFVNRVATRMDTEEQQLREDIRGGRCKGLFHDLSLVKHSPPSMEPQGSLLWTQEPANGSFPQIDEFSQHLHTCPFNMLFNIIPASMSWCRTLRSSRQHLLLIWEAPFSNLGPDTQWTDRVFRIFPQFLHAYADIVPSIRRRSHPSTPVPIHYNSEILFCIAWATDIIVKHTINMIGLFPASGCFCSEFPT